MENSTKSRRIINEIVPNHYDFANLDESANHDVSANQGDSAYHDNSFNLDDSANHDDFANHADKSLDFYYAKLSKLIYRSSVLVYSKERLH